MAAFVVAVLVVATVVCKIVGFVNTGCSSTTKLSKRTPDFVRGAEVLNHHGS